MVFFIVLVYRQQNIIRPTQRPKKTTIKSISNIQTRKGHRELITGALFFFFFLLLSQSLLTFKQILSDCTKSLSVFVLSKEIIFNGFSFLSQETYFQIPTIFFNFHCYMRIKYANYNPLIRANIQTEKNGKHLYFLSSLFSTQKQT